MGRFALPTAQAQLWRSQLLALAQPTRPQATATETPSATPPTPPTPSAVVWGQAWVEWIERYPVGRLPDAGGVSATAVVHIPLATLLGGLAPAHLDTGAVLSAGQARRLACEAGIIPVVLDGASRVLDLGRTRRFHSRAQRIALGVRDGGCTAELCEQPPGLCHAHHDLPWSTGGPTTLDQGRLLCPRHHRMIHDTRYTHPPAHREGTDPPPHVSPQRSRAGLPPTGEGGHDPPGRRPPGKGPRGVRIRDGPRNFRRCCGASGDDDRPVRLVHRLVVEVGSAGPTGARVGRAA